jgi:hypothetical protein
MIKKNIQCSLADLEKMMALRDQGRHAFDGVVSSRHCKLREDDGTVGPEMAWVIGVTGSRTAWVHIVVSPGRTTLLQAQERLRRLGDEACVVDEVTGSGKMAACKGLDHGQKQWCGGSAEDSTTVRRLRGGRDDGMGSEEVDDGAGSKEIFGRKFWQADGVSESLRGLGFAKTMQQFIYRGTTVATDISDIIGAIATENHSSDGPLPSLDCC